jgi:hypothetical protein
MQVTRAQAAAVITGVLMFSSFGLTSVASAGGPPANGTVGNADDKAPGGQWFGDHNKGYECDDNPGVGDGNPAHSFDCYDEGDEGDER